VNDRILFSPDFITFTLSITGSYEDANQLGDFDITDSVLIQGNGITQTILDGGLVDRLFHVLTGTVGIESLAITNVRPQSVLYGAIPPGRVGRFTMKPASHLTRLRSIPTMPPT
jgi:hypothetical protein